MPTFDKLSELPHEELLVVSAWLWERVQHLEAEIAALKQAPPPPGTSSRNSSQPPARDWKANAPPKTRKRGQKKPGAQVGHPKAERPWVAKPDTIIEARVMICAGCGADLQAVEPKRVVRRQITELPMVKPMTIETQQYEVCCPDCHLTQAGPLPVGLEAERWLGPRLEALITYFHHEHHLSYERVQEVLQDVLGISLSTGGEVGVVERAGAAAQPEAHAIADRVRDSAVIGSDETSCRVKGRTHWQWVFVSEAGVYHLIRPSRGQPVVAEFMGAHLPAEVWVSDCWSPQLQAPAAQHQLCLPHQLRALQGLIDRRPHLRWARELHTLFRTAIHLGHRRAQLTPRGFQCQVTQLEHQVAHLLQRPITGVGANLLKRYRTHQAHLFVFLHRTDVPADNNACERALRPAVIHRKVLGGFRSDWGAQAYAALATVLDTAKQAGENVFQKLVSLMGQPILQYVHAESR